MVRNTCSYWNKLLSIIQIVGHYFGIAKNFTQKFIRYVYNYSSNCKILTTKKIINISYSLSQYNFITLLVTG